MRKACDFQESMNIYDNSDIIFLIIKSLFIMPVIAGSQQVQNMFRKQWWTRRFSLTFTTKTKTKNIHAINYSKDSPPSPSIQWAIGWWIMLPEEESLGNLIPGCRCIHLCQIIRQKNAAKTRCSSLFSEHIFNMLRPGNHRHCKQWSND